MDALKFAFDTTIVGVLALPWLAIVVFLYLATYEETAEPLKELFQGPDGKPGKLPAAAASVLLSRWLTLWARSCHAFRRIFSMLDSRVRSPSAYGLRHIARSWRSWMTPLKRIAKQKRDVS